MQRNVMIGLFSLAACVSSAAADENSDNLAAVALRRYAAASVLWIWPAGSTIEGCFINGTADERQMVVDGADTWMKIANIRFDFGAQPNYRTCPQTAPFPPLRVNFGVGSNSTARLGTFGHGRPNEKPTMFIANMLPSKKPILVENLRSTILHEFGHILGLGHEHQHPESACFHMVAWTELCAKREVSKRLPSYLVVNWLPTIGQANPDYAAGHPYDPHSIMHYKISAKSLTGPATTCMGARNTTPSDGDKIKIARLYPKTRAEQQAMIQSQAPLIARAILATKELDQPAAERVAREGERIVRRAFVDLQAFRIDLAGGIGELKQGRNDRGGLALSSFGTGAVEAAAAACAKAEAPLGASAMHQIRKGAH